MVLDATNTLRIWMNCIKEGKFHLLIEELELYRVQLQEYFGMSLRQCEALLQMLAPHLRRQSSDYLI